MLRVLVRHGAPAPCSRRKGNALGAGSSGYWIPVWWDANSCWLIPAAERSPTRRPRATRDGPPVERGPIRRAARREAVPWVTWETRGPSRPPARRGYPNNFRANRGPSSASGIGFLPGVLEAAAPVTRPSTASGGGRRVPHGRRVDAQGARPGPPAPAARGGRQTTAWAPGRRGWFGSAGAIRRPGSSGCGTWRSSSSHAGTRSVPTGVHANVLSGVPPSVPQPDRAGARCGHGHLFVHLSVPPTPGTPTVPAGVHLVVPAGPDRRSPDTLAGHPVVPRPSSGRPRRRRARGGRRWPA
jgi:hypothetical protein